MILDRETMESEETKSGRKFLKNVVFNKPVLIV